jgi:hypothetical protein
MSRIVIFILGFLVATGVSVGLLMAIGYYISFGAKSI